MNSWEKNSISPEFHPATKPLTVEPVDSGNEIDLALACPQLAEEHFADLNMSTKEKQFDILYVAFTLTMI